MGIQINGQTDTITAIDGGLNVSGADLGSASAGSLNVTGIVTASGFSGNITGNLTGNVNASGVSTVTDLRVGTAVTANSDGIQVGAGKSIRIFGSASGYSNLVASSAAGASELLLPSTGGTIDRLNRAGNVLQVVNTSNTTDYSSSTNAYISIGLSLAITPTSSTSKILMLCSMSGVGKETGNTYATFRLDKNGSALQTFIGIYAGITNTTATNYSAGTSFQYLDSPATTSAVTYEIKMNSDNNVAVVVAYRFKSITLMEIAA